MSGVVPSPQRNRPTSHLAEALAEVKNPPTVMAEAAEIARP
jgi:hypothetical protein